MTVADRLLRRKRVSSAIVRRHKSRPSQFDLRLSILSPGMVPWVPSDSVGSSVSRRTMARWCGPLPEPVCSLRGSAWDAYSLADVASAGRESSWWIVCDVVRGSAIRIGFALRVGALHCPVPEWWRLVSVSSLPREVLDYLFGQSDAPESESR